MLHASTKLKARGYFTGKVLDKNGKEIVSKRFHTENAITNAARVAWLQEASNSGTRFFYTSYRLHMGVGTTELTATSTGLSSPVGTYSATVSPGLRTDIYASRAETVDNLDGTATWRHFCTYNFAIGDFNGQALSEVGLFSSTTLYAGQLIKDEFGNPTTVTVLNDEQLIIQYTVELIVPNARYVLGTGSIDFGQGPVGYTIYGFPFAQEAAGTTTVTSRFENNVNILGDVLFMTSAHLSPGGNVGDVIRVDDIAQTNPSYTTLTNGIRQAWNMVIAPSTFASTDIRLMVFGAYWRDTISPDGSDPFQSYSGQYLYSIAFDAPVSKSNTQALSLNLAIDTVFQDVV